MNVLLFASFEQNSLHKFRVKMIAINENVEQRHEKEKQINSTSNYSF